MKQRNQTIDIAKGIAIILMVIGHCYEGDNAVSRLIYAFHMPFFFLISGTLYAEKWKNGITFSLPSTARKLLVPYFVFDALFALFMLVLGRANNLVSSFLNVLIHQVLPLLGRTVTWYLPCYLMVLCIFIPVVWKGKKLFSMLLFASIYLIALLIPAPSGISQLWRSLIGTGFFAVGYYAKHLFFTKCKLSQLVIAGLFYLWLSQYNGRVGLAGLQFSNPFLYTTNGLLGSWILIQICMRMQVNRWTSWIVSMGKNTVIVLCTHMFAVEIIRVLDYKLSGDVLRKIGIMEGIVLGGIVVLIMFPLIAFCNRFAPKLFGK